MKKLFSILLVLITSLCSLGQKVYLIPQGNGEIYRPNASGWKPGDTIKITGTNYSVIEFTGLKGAPGKDIIIEFTQPTLSGPVRIKNNNSYVTILAAKLKVNGAMSVQMSDHIYWKGGEAYGSSIGIYCKQDAEYGNPYTYGTSGYVMRKITFDGVYIHDVQGEGTYIGHTSPEGQWTRRPGLSDTLISVIPLDSVSFINGRVENCGWDGVQISNAGRGALIANTRIKNVGLKRESQQGNGAMIGGNTQGSITNTTIENSNGAGIAVFGFGTCGIYSNTLLNTGIDANPDGSFNKREPAMYFKKNHYMNEKLQVNVGGNKIDGASQDGIVNAVRTDWGIPGAWANNAITNIRSGVKYKSSIGDVVTGDGQIPVPPVANPPAATVSQSYFDSVVNALIAAADMRYSNLKDSLNSVIVFREASLLLTKEQLQAANNKIFVLQAQIEALEDKRKKTLELWQ